MNPRVAAPSLAEFVTFQRNLRRLSDDDLISALRQKFLTELCAPTRDVAFYVGNQAKREQTFSVLGIHYPRRLGSMPRS
ncbi:MAG TPA: hypothetical protein VIY28_05345 [Pseudonocardiaceae bacterium]